MPPVYKVHVFMYLFQTANKLVQSQKDFSQVWAFKIGIAAIKSQFSQQK